LAYQKLTHSGRCRGRPASYIRGVKFFIVDDDPDIVALLVKTLEEGGHMVQQSTSSREALARIPELRPDCVITDIMMPDMDGFELTRELRRRAELSTMKIIVLSMKSYEFDRRRAKQLGADGYITKPIKRETLLITIEDILSEHVVVGY